MSPVINAGQRSLYMGTGCKGSQKTLCNHPGYRIRQEHRCSGAAKIKQGWLPRVLKDIVTLPLRSSIQESSKT